jgi:hypothetical protein
MLILWLLRVEPSSAREDVGRDISLKALTLLTLAVGTVDVDLIIWGMLWRLDDADFEDAPLVRFAMDDALVDFCCCV